VQGVTVGHVGFKHVDNGAGSLEIANRVDASGGLGPGGNTPPLIARRHPTSGNQCEVASPAFDEPLRDVKTHTTEAAGHQVGRVIADP
jgi:hypothetical protein